MPDLPTLTLTTKTETATILALFGDADGYRSWLAAAVRDEVERRTVAASDEAANNARRVAIDTQLAAVPSLIAAAETTPDLPTADEG